jgi:hypothetical protein
MQLASSNVAPSNAPNVPKAPGDEGRVLDVYGGALASIVGVRSMGYDRVNAPGELRVSFDSFDFAKLADNTLRDVVLGVRLVFTDAHGTPFDMAREGAAWTSRASNSARLIAAMPGVVSRMDLGDATVYYVEDARVRSELAALVEKRPNGLLAIWNFAHRTPPS